MTTDELVAACAWPAIPERCLAALHEIVEYTFSRFSTVVGLIACGSILRGTPDPSSDFDIYGVQHAPFRQRIQKYFRKVPAEIFVNPPAAIERYLCDESAAGRPITAHMLATGFLMLDRDPVVESLRGKARYLLDRPPVAEWDLRMQRYLIATAFEDAADVASKDEQTARFLLGQAVERALRVRFLDAGSYISRQKVAFRELASFDPALAALFRQFYSQSEFEDLFATARRIVDAVAGAHAFFEWESEPEEVRA